MVRAVRRRVACVIVVLGVGPLAHAQVVHGPDVFVDAGVADGGSISAARRTDASWFAGITIASPPRNLGRRWTFGAGARVAREPVLAMASVGGAIVPAYFDAARASASFWFVHTSGAFETAIVGRYAETWMDPAQRLTAASNDNGHWTFLFEATTHFRWYARRDAQMPAAGRRLMPIVDVYGGVKHDRRFHRHGELDPYDDPTGRALAGVFVVAWRWRGADRVARMTLGAGADFETALRTGIRLPSAARAQIRVDVDVRRLVDPSR